MSDTIATTRSAAPAAKAARTKAAKPKVKAVQPKAAPPKAPQKAAGKVKASKAAQAELKQTTAAQQEAEDVKPTPAYQDIFTLTGGDVKQAIQHFRIKLLEALESIPDVHAVDVFTSKNTGSVEYVAFVTFPGRGPGRDTQFGIRIWEND